MKVEIKESLKVGERYFKAPVMVFETLAEASAEAGGEANLLKKLNSWGHAHGSAADLRELIIEITEEVSGTKPAEIPTDKRDDKGIVITRQEDQSVYVKRVFAKTPEAFDKVQAILDKRARGYKFKDGDKEIDVPALAVSMKTRPPGVGRVKKLPSKYFEAAKEFVTAKLVPGGQKAVAKFIPWAQKEYNAVFTPVEGKPIDCDENITALGWMQKAKDDALKLNIGGGFQG